MSDDSGVMGNLPRSRPGRRSEKRATGGGAKATKAKAAPKSRATAASKPRASATEPRAAASKPRPRAQRPAAGSAERVRAAEPQPARPPAGDPLTEAVRVAGAVAGAGLKVATGILRRLPRP